MFDITRGSEGEIVLKGSFVAAHADKARDVFASVDSSSRVDFSGLSYISSAGMGVLLGVQKRLSGSGHALTLVNLNPHIREIFRIAGFDRIFKIE